jgi:hypothetical protein
MIIQKYRRTSNMKKSNKKLLEENQELTSALKAYGRLEMTITQMEQELQKSVMEKFALLEYCKTLGGDELGFKTFLEGKMKEELDRQKNKEVGAKVDILGADGKPMTTEGKD